MFQKPPPSFVPYGWTGVSAGSPGRPGSWGSPGSCAAAGAGAAIAIAHAAASASVPCLPRPRMAAKYAAWVGACAGSQARTGTASEAIASISSEARSNSSSESTGVPSKGRSR